MLETEVVVMCKSQEKLLPNISRMWEGYPHAYIPCVSFLWPVSV